MKERIMAELKDGVITTKDTLSDIADGIFNIDTELTSMKNNNAEANEKIVQALQDLASHVSDLDDRLRIVADTVETGLDRLGDIIAKAIAQAVEDMDK
jgi:methyl-accepting chemotaxis protein